MCARSVTENFNCDDYEPGALLGQYDMIVDNDMKRCLEGSIFIFGSDRISTSFVVGNG